MTPQYKNDQSPINGCQEWRLRHPVGSTSRFHGEKKRNEKRTVLDM